MMLGYEQARKIIKQLAKKRLGVFMNLFTRREAKTGLTILDHFSYKTIFWKTFQREMLIISQTTTLLQIFCELKLYSHVIVKSMSVADWLYFLKEL